MNQKIRNKTFETNSSSTHSIAIYNKEYSSNPGMYRYNIPLIDAAHDMFLKTKEDILSYLYTLSVVRHHWLLHDRLRDTYYNCIFQKPIYDLTAYTPEDEKQYDVCYDRSVTSFCDVVNASLPSPYYEDEDLDLIADNLEAIVETAEIYVGYDSSYEHHIIGNKLKDNSEEVISKYIADNIKLIIRGN